MEERLVQVTEQEVRIEFALNCKCRAKVRLKSLNSTTTIAFKVQTSSPQKFMVNPPTGLIAPLSYATFQVILKPQSQLPSSYPRSPSDRFLIKTAKFDTNSGISTQLDSLNSWFTSISAQSTQDLKLKVVFVGPLLLRHAVSCEDLEAVKSLIKRQRSIALEFSPTEAMSLFRVATESRHGEKMIKLLVDAGLDPDPRRGSDNENRKITSGRQLMESGAEEEGESRNGGTTGYGGRDEYMDRKTKENLVDRTFQKNCSLSHFDVAGDKEFKRQKEAMEELKKGEMVLMAARRGEVEQLTSLIERGASINYRDQYGLTALHAAAIKGHKNAVLMLLELGLDIETQDNEGHAPLHVAVAGGSKETVEVLIKCGANVNVQSKKGATPLHMAKALGYDDISQILANMGAYSLPASSFPSLLTIFE